MKNISQMKTAASPVAHHQGEPQLHYPLNPLNRSPVKVWSKPSSSTTSCNAKQPRCLKMFHVICAKNNTHLHVARTTKVISIIACCHSVKLCALAAWAFRSQQMQTSPARMWPQHHLPPQALKLQKGKSCWVNGASCLSKGTIGTAPNMKWAKSNKTIAHRSSCVTKDFALALGKEDSSKNLPQSPSPTIHNGGLKLRPLCPAHLRKRIGRAKSASTQEDLKVARKRQSCHKLVIGN